MVLFSFSRHLLELSLLGVPDHSMNGHDHHIGLLPYSVPFLSSRQWEFCGDFSVNRN